MCFDPASLFLLAHPSLKMSEQQNISSILANLGNSPFPQDLFPLIDRPSAAPQPDPRMSFSASVPPPPQQYYVQNGPPRPPPQQSYNAIPQSGGQSGVPRPTGSGTMNLYDVVPSNSGSLSLSNAPPAQYAYYASNPPPVYQSSRSRSRSPRRSVLDSSRNGHNPYRADRRTDAYNRDPSPRGRESPDRRYSPLSGRRVPGAATSSGSNSVTEKIAIDSSAVGLVIGRSGENMRRLEASTRTRIQFAPASESKKGLRTCTITGSRAAIEDAIHEIERTMAEHDKPSKASSGRAPPPPGRNLSNEIPIPGRTEPENKEGTSLTIRVPSKTVGLIIGKGGESIKNIQDRSHCHVNIMTEDQNVNGMRPVHLLGTPSQQAAARDIIMDIVHTDAKTLPHDMAAMRDGVNSTALGNKNANGEKMTVNVSVPSEAVGMIIGKGGEAVREMQDHTNCKINVSQPSGRDIEREIELIGSRSAIQQARNAINEKVQAVVSLSGY